MATSWTFSSAEHDRLRATLVGVADDAVAAIIEEVPAYAGPFTGHRGQRIREAVRLALEVFLGLAVRQATDAPDPLADEEAALARVGSEAYDLGRGEARSGRSMDALLTAYRIGARVAWGALSREAVAAGMPAAAVGVFAEQVFSYIDDLSAASAAGHADELQTRGRVRDRALERLARALATGEDDDELDRRCERAGWTPPETLTAALLPTSAAAGVLPALHPDTLHVAGELPGLDEDTTLLLVPDLDAAGRRALAARLQGHAAVLGPTRGWRRARSSVDRARRAAALPRGAGVLDTEEHLVELVVTADPEAYEDLRAAALAPLAGLRPASRARFEETLRAWLLRQGRRELVAADLFVHPQTVRYRVGRLRELYGPALDDPKTVRALLIALA